MRAQRCEGAQHVVDHRQDQRSITEPDIDGHDIAASGTSQVTPHASQCRPNSAVGNPACQKPLATL